MGQMAGCRSVLDDEVEEPEAALAPVGGEGVPAGGEVPVDEDVAPASEIPDVLPEPPADDEVVPNDPETPDDPDDDELPRSGPLPSAFLPSLSIFSKKLLGFGMYLNFNRTWSRS
jgi:hypothetical protein